MRYYTYEAPFWYLPSKLALITSGIMTDTYLTSMKMETDIRRKDRYKKSISAKTYMTPVRDECQDYMTHGRNQKVIIV